MKIIIKLPVGEKGKFKLQSRGSVQGRRFRTASGVLEYLDDILERKLMPPSPLESKEKIAIVVKEYMGSHFENINETLDHTDREYLIYATSCFLEDFLTRDMQKRYENRWTKYIKGGDRK